MTLMRTLHDELGPTEVRAFGHEIGADEGATGNAVDTAIPMMIVALAERAREPVIRARLAAVISGAATATPRTIFGGRAPQLEGALADVSGMSAASASRLLRLLTPIMVSAIARRIGADSGSDHVAELLMTECAGLNESAPGAYATLNQFMLSRHSPDHVEDGDGILGSVFGSRD